MKLKEIIDYLQTTFKNDMNKDIYMVCIFPQKRWEAEMSTSKVSGHSIIHDKKAKGLTK